MRGVCRVCGRSIAIRKNGTLRGHGPGVGDPYAAWCMGSSLPPVGGAVAAPPPRPARGDWFEDVRGD